MIELENLGFYFHPDQWIFRHHSLAIRPGEIVAVLGPNGRGKTTLIKTILGLLPVREGRVSQQAELGYVPQYSSPVFPYSVLDIILMGRIRHLGLFSTPGRRDYTVTRNIMKQLGLERFADRRFSQLSGGEKQLVLIARALVSDGRGLILDEPASALDFKNQDMILKTMHRLSREQGLTILFTTHYPQHAVHIADRVLLMHAPEEYQYGPTGDIMSDEHLKRLYGMEVTNVTVDYGSRSIRTVIPVFS